MERDSHPGDGLIGTNWHSAVASNSFDTNTPKGTPRSINIIDTTSPVIDSGNIIDNTLFAIGNITLTYNYSDNMNIDDTSSLLVLEKWNGNNWSDVTNENITSTLVSTTQATHYTKTLTFGKYRSNFSIGDSTGNRTTKVTTFYVDKLEFSISTGSIQIGNLVP
jgi:hypothetical protein